MSRHTVDGVVRECEELLRLGVRSVILFGIPEEKDDDGSGAWIADGIVQQALRALRPRFPELLLLTDVCLCEYTAHGHCGVLRGRGGRQRRVARAARPHGRLARRGGRRRRLPERHDGRARRRDPRGAARDADRLLRRQVRLGLLRAVPRGGGLGAGVRRPPRLPDGSGQRARGAARVRARHRRGGGRGPRQAGAALPRRRSGPCASASTSRSAPTTSRASTRWSRPRPRPGDLDERAAAIEIADRDPPRGRARS